MTLKELISTRKEQILRRFMLGVAALQGNAGLLTHSRPPRLRRIS